MSPAEHSEMTEQQLHRRLLDERDLAVAILALTDEEVRRQIRHCVRMDAGDANAAGRVLEELTVAAVKRFMKRTDKGGVA